MIDQYAEIDLEHLENAVYQGQFHRIHWECDEGHYFLTKRNSDWYGLSIHRVGDISRGVAERRGLRTILDFIETMYPAFYAYLVTTYPKNNKESEEHHDIH